MSPTQPPDRHYCSRSRPTRSGTPTASPRRSPRYPAFVKPVIPFSRIRVLSFLNSSVLVGVIEDFRFREPARRSTYAMPRRGAAVHVAAGIADIAALAAQGCLDGNGAGGSLHAIPTAPRLRCIRSLAADAQVRRPGSCVRLQRPQRRQRDRATRGRGRVKAIPVLNSGCQRGRRSALGSKAEPRSDSKAI